MATMPGSRRGALRNPGATGLMGDRGRVSRGRPGLAGGALLAVHQPTVLIVGERGPMIIEFNRAAMEIVAGASHLFDEPGTVEHMAGLARVWFTRSVTVPAEGRNVDDFC